MQARHGSLYSRDFSFARVPETQASRFITRALAWTGKETFSQAGIALQRALQREPNNPTAKALLDAQRQRMPRDRQTPPLDHYWIPCKTPLAGQSPVARDAACTAALAWGLLGYRMTAEGLGYRGLARFHRAQAGEAGYADLAIVDYRAALLFKQYDTGHLNRPDSAALQQQHDADTARLRAGLADVLRSSGRAQPSLRQINLGKPA